MKDILSRRDSISKGVEDESLASSGHVSSVVWSRGWGVFVQGVEGQQRATGEERLAPEFALACHAAELALCP